MATRTPPALALLCVLLALAIAFAGWSALRAPQVEVPSPIEGSAIKSPHLRQDVDETTLVDLAQPQAKPPTEKTPVATNQERMIAVTSAELELADAIWISGRIVWPEHTPIGEEVDVIATGKAFKSRGMHRVRVEPSGNFRVAVAPSTRSAFLSIDAPHVFLPQPTRVKLKEGKPASDVLLEPKLGGRLIGQMRLPPGGESVAPELVGKEVNSWGWTQGDFANGCNRTGVVDANLRFELRGLDPAPEHTLHFDSGIVVAASIEGLKVEAGVTRPLDVDLRLGVRLLGRVSSPGDEAAQNMSVQSTTEADPSATEADKVRTLGYSGASISVFGESLEMRAKLDEQGRFDLRGVAPGRITLRATATQRTAAVLELGELADGERREGLELKLGLGGQIGGVVRWPDGSPAVGADIELEFAGDEEARRESAEHFDSGYIGNVKTDASGAFLINGLVHGPFHVQAEAKSREPAVKGKPKPPAWKVKSEPVAIGTRTLELVLQGGTTIHGSVVDDAGAPIERFSLSATPKNGDDFDDSKTVTARFRAKDGRFELGGLIDGTQRVSLTVAQHDAPLPLIIDTPAQTGPFTLVAVRRGTITGIVQCPDGTPAARASLQVHRVDSQQDEGYAGRADSKGLFKTKAIPAGQLALQAKLDGFASSDPYPLQVAPGQTISGVILVLHRGSRISGEVHATREGETVSGREVNAYHHGAGGSSECTTDANGHFLLEGLDPGKYTITLQASPEEKKSLSRSDDANEEHEWEMEQSLLRSATANVEDGGETHVVFGSPRRAAIRLGGVVRRGGEAAAFVRVRAVLTDAADERDAVHALSDESGRFELLVSSAGSYRVHAKPGGYNSISAVRTVEVPAGGLDGLELSLGDGRIAGRVQVHSSADQGHIQVMLERSEQENAWGVTDGGDWPAAEFAFENVPAGSYTLITHVWVSGQDGRSLPALDPVRRPITLEEGQQVVDLLIEISDR